MEGSTLRTATVAIEVPEAMSARRSWSIETMPPVPMIRRDPRVTPATVSPVAAGPGADPVVTEGSIDSHGTAAAGDALSWVSRRRRR